MSQVQEKVKQFRCGYAKNEWPHCPMCDGRMHLLGCTSRMKKDMDCCAARHRMPMPLR